MFLNSLKARRSHLRHARYCAPICPFRLYLSPSSAESLDFPLLSSGAALITPTTESSGNYSFTVPNLPPPPGAYYYLAVGIPNLDYATIPGYSQINSSGNSSQFALSAGAPPVQTNAGLRSMNVTTLLDDPNTPFQDQITLRDAIETGNNGPPTTAVTFQQGLSGSIGLLKPLDPIEISYNIIGPESDPITVDGNGTGTVFTINSGGYSDIDGLVIEGGNSADGGNLDNNGTLRILLAGVITSVRYQRLSSTLSTLLL